MEHVITHTFNVAGSRLSLRAFEVEARNDSGKVELRGIGKEALRSGVLDYISAERWNDDGKDHLTQIIQYATEAIRKIDEAAAKEAA
jgi:hypothetical protein